MKHFALSTVIALAFAISANAQEATIVTVAADPTAEIVATEQLQADFSFICASAAQLSEKAQVACVTNTMPKVAKSGETFRNVGIGAEFNTLIRNKAAF